MNENTTVEIITGTIKQGDNKGKEWKAIKLHIGDWSTVIFTKTNFEMQYIEKVLND